MLSEAVQKELDALVRARLQTNERQIAHSLNQIAAGNPLGSEPNAARRVARLAAKTGLDRRQAEALSASIEKTATDLEAPSHYREVMSAAVGSSTKDAVFSDPRTRPEAVWGTVDFVGVEFFSRGRRAADSVGRIMFQNGRVQGTGFLVGPGLLLTNNHVIETAADAASMCLQLDFELDDQGVDRSATVFQLDPGRCFAWSPIDRLDFSLVAVGARISGSKHLDDFGYIPLSDAGDKHMLGELANIIQHPDGRPKQVVLRENNLIGRDETVQVLHYLADTQPGSSGSPVLNNQWEAIALHHWAGPHLETRAIDGRLLRLEVNEGIRISAIVKALRTGELVRDARSAQTVAEVLQTWAASRPGGLVPPAADRQRVESGPGARNNADGSISWTFPIEITVRAPMLTPGVPPASSPAPATPDIQPEERRGGPEDLSDRGGYEPGFIHGFHVPLPGYSRVGYRLARNLQSRSADDRYELRYHHFTVVMNAERRLAAFTACNIDGARIKAIDRKTKTATSNPTLRDLGVESLGAEASDAFREDSRLSSEEQMGRAFYENQQVPGFDKPVFPGNDASDAVRKRYYKAMAERTARMLQKGHLTLRGDPAWGTDDEAIAAENDTFYYTNAVPQFGFFNQGSRADQPGSKGKLRWRTVETYVLRNAVTERQRICVFAGPVFRDNDPDYRFDSKLPLRFWKIAVWAEDRRLHSVAVVADQGEVLRRLTQGVPEGMGTMPGAEAFDDPDELARVSQFLTTVREIERLTGLDFGDDVRDGDIRAGQEGLAPIDDVRVDRTSTDRASAHLGKDGDH